LTIHNRIKFTAVLRILIDSDDLNSGRGVSGQWRGAMRKSLLVMSLVLCVSCSNLADLLYDLVSSSGEVCAVCQRTFQEASDDGDKEIGVLDCSASVSELISMT
jgi:hypothetical protein